MLKQLTEVVVGALVNFRQRLYDALVYRAARVGWGEERTPTFCGGEGKPLGFLRHPNLRLKGGTNAVSAGQCDGWDVFLHRESGGTKADFAGGLRGRLGGGGAGGEGKSRWASSARIGGQGIHRRMSANSENLEQDSLG